MERKKIVNGKPEAGAGGGEMRLGRENKNV